MLINCDVKSLELVVAAELSNDKVMKEEICNKEDLHENNRQKFGLPSRLIAKIFNFRLIYGGSAYSYANDPEFSSVSNKVIFWEKVIDAYYSKYHGLYKWHQELLRICQKNDGVINIPSGRYYKFLPDYQRREPWPLTQIKNYPVQGFGADLVMLARIDFFNRFMESGLEGYFIQTIHDSLVADVPRKNIDAVAQMMQDSVARVPELCYNRWNYKFSLPMTSEVLIGPNKLDMKELNANHA